MGNNRDLAAGAALRFIDGIAKGTFMTTQIGTRSAIAPAVAHELHFASLHNPGRGVVVPCDESGHVDIDSLPQRLRIAYLGARAMLGREYLYPTVHRAH